MPALQSFTRTQLRQAIGYQAGAVYVSTTTSAGNAGGTTVVDTTVIGATDEHKGKWLYATGGANIGTYRRVTAFDAAGTFTVAPAFGAQVANTTTYELWSDLWEPAKIHSFINQAITMASGRVYTPKEGISLHTHIRAARYAIPTNFSILQKIFLRANVQNIPVANTTGAWAEAAAPSGVTRSVDNVDFRYSGANKFVVTAAVAAATVLSSIAITSLDIHAYDTIECWVKSSVTAASGDLQLLLDDTALVASPLETLSIPALVAGAWTFVRMTLATPQLDTAIISVGLKYTTDLGAGTFWIEDVRAVRDVSAEWQVLSPEAWRIDRQAREIVFKAPPPYALMKLSGGYIPAQLTTDTPTVEVDPQFIIAQTLAFALQAIKDERWGTWQGVAERRAAMFPSLQLARFVD